MSENVHI